jgi:hypothetical protein
MPHRRRNVEFRFCQAAICRETASIRSLSSAKYWFWGAESTRRPPDAFGGIKPGTVQRKTVKAQHSPTLAPERPQQARVMLRRIVQDQQKLTTRGGVIGDRSERPKLRPSNFNSGRVTSYHSQDRLSGAADRTAERSREWRKMLLRMDSIESADFRERTLPSVVRSQLSVASRTGYNGPLTTDN